MVPICDVGVTKVPVEPCDHVSAAVEDTGCGASHADHSPVAMITLLAPPTLDVVVSKGQRRARTGEEKMNGKAEEERERESEWLLVRIERYKK